jgi:predicted transcriptional regulator
MSLKEQILEMFQEDCRTRHPVHLSNSEIRFSLNIGSFIRPYVGLQSVREAVAELVQEGHLVRSKVSEYHSVYGLAENEKISIYKEILARILQDSPNEITPVQIARKAKLHLGYTKKVLEVLKAEGQIQEAGFQKTANNTLYKIQG